MKWKNYKMREWSKNERDEFFLCFFLQQVGGERGFGPRFFKGEVSNVSKLQGPQLMKNNGSLLFL